MSNNLISARRLVEAGYTANFWIPKYAFTDGFAPATFLLYRLALLLQTTLRVIVMENAGHMAVTWNPKATVIKVSTHVFTYA